MDTPTTDAGSPFARAWQRLLNDQNEWKAKGFDKGAILKESNIDVDEMARFASTIYMFSVAEYTEETYRVYTAFLMGIMLGERWEQEKHV